MKMNRSKKLQSNIIPGVKWRQTMHSASRTLSNRPQQKSQNPNWIRSQKNKQYSSKLFFAVKLNAVDSEIKDVLESLKRDLVDNCDIFL
jgi:hypothetical protein